MRLIEHFPGDTRSELVWQPMRVRARMQEPVVAARTEVHLDGVLSWGAFVAYEREHGRGSLPPMTSKQCVDFDLGLATWAHGDVWGWCASAVRWPDEVLRGTDYVRRKPPLDEYVRHTQAKRTDIGVGPAKAHNKPVPVTFAQHVEWYALGDVSYVRRILDDVRAIGKLVGHGHGTVIEWIVEPFEHDWSIERDGKLMRRMPSGWGGRESTHWGAVRAPYHHITRHCDAVGPEC